MPQPADHFPANSASRRQFIKNSTAAVVASSVTAQLGAMRSVHAAGSDMLKIGLIGCGGRGAGAALDALKADSNIELVALGDAFEDRVEKSLASLSKTEVGNRVKVDADHKFVGFDAYQGVTDSVDVVLLAAPPHFRPLHLKYAVEKGKHMFVEKPVAVDAPGVRSVLESVEEAKRKGLALVSGLCWRYHPAAQETVRRVQDGQIGEIRSLESTRYLHGVGKVAPRKPEWTDMEYQMRNWYYFTWLSGDFFVEQYIHELDRMNWVLNKGYPLSCTAIGGRQTRIAPEYGHIYDHFYAIYEYADNIKFHAATRHQRGCSNPHFDTVIGTTGRASMNEPFAITGKNPWKWKEPMPVSHYQIEHNELFRHIRSGEPINNGDYMAKSTLMAIMARMSAYTGKTISWDQAFNSIEDLTPARYDWDLVMPDPPVAMPGLTPFI